MNKQLLETFLHYYPFQPATAYWRAVEIDMVLRHADLTGNGLDLGCGDGKLTQIIFDRLPPADRTLTGMDLDPQEVYQANRKPVYEHVYVASADKIPEPDASFNYVVSNSVLEHIPVIEPVVAEVGRLLRPGGIFLFTVPGIGFRPCMRGPLRPDLDREQYLDGLDRRIAHYRYFSIAQWRELLGEHEITVEKALPYLSCQQMKRWETLSRFTGGLLYAVFGERDRPIQIQRRLGMRDEKREQHMPLPLARMLTGWIDAGVPETPPTLSEQQAGCILVVGRKR